jgi:MarR-like DNA-binding transcriptional regulator SgrR of sgrS sRNA
MPTSLRDARWYASRAMGLTAALPLHALALRFPGLLLFWQFELGRGNTFHDGTALTSDAVASSLRVANPSWKVFAAGEGVVVECDSACPQLAAELALPHNGIAKRDGRLLGTGPFAITQWETGKRLRLTAQDEYWAGRAFLDTIEIELGKSLREQMIASDLGKTDLIEIAPEQAHRAAENRHVESAPPAELMALVFTRDRQSPEEGRLREALAFSIDRGLLNNVLLQGGGEITGGLLPAWMNGYGFLFPAEVNLERARQTGAGIRQASAWTLAYDTNDPIARLIAERIALNAYDAGLAVQLANSPAADIRLVRIPLVSLDGRIALTHLASALGLPQPKVLGDSVDDLYAAESSLLHSQRVIPLLHLRQSYGMSAQVKNWNEGRDGSWRLQDAWLGVEKP